MRMALVTAVCIAALAGCGQDAPKSRDRDGAEKTGAAGACGGFAPALSAQENALRASAFIDTLPPDARDETVREMVATLTALPAFAPVYPCATGLSADTAPDGAGNLQLTFEVEANPETVAAFYAEQFRGQGEVDTISEEANGALVRTVSVTTPRGGVVEVNVIVNPGEDGRNESSVVLRTEGLQP